MEKKPKYDTYFSIEFGKNLKCKTFLIDFLNELGNFKQEKFYTSKSNFFLHFTTTDPKNYLSIFIELTHFFVKLKIEKILFLFSHFRYARENLALVNVYIKDPAVTQIKRDQKVPLIWFVANVGGMQS